jgi:outer membrane protein TolC
MKIQQLAALLAIGVAGMTAMPGLAQQPATAAPAPAAPVIRLSLADSIRRALDEGTAARLATTRIDIATAQARLAQSALPFQPQVSAGTLTANESINLATFGFSVPGQPPVTPPFNVIDFHITAAVQLLDVAARRRYEAAKAGIRVGEEERRRIENDIAAAVSSLYVSLGRSSARIDEIRADVDLFEKLRQLAVDQKKAGIGTKLDTTRAEVQLARQRQALLVAGNQRDLARLALLRAIGADYDAEVELTDDWTRPAAPVLPLGQALAAARRERLELSVLDRQLRVADLNLEAAKAEKLPTIAAQAQGTESGNRLSQLDWSRTIGATVNVPIFTGRRIEARVAEARALRDQIVLQRGDVERQVEQEVRQALLGYENARSRVELASQSVQLAQDELELASDRFKNGIASSIEVDNAQTSLAAARDSRIEALADEAQARFDLARATGEIRNLIPGGEEAPAPPQNVSK